MCIFVLLALLVLSKNHKLGECSINIQHRVWHSISSKPPFLFCVCVFFKIHGVLSSLLFNRGGLGDGVCTVLAQFIHPFWKCLQKLQATASSEGSHGHDRVFNSVWHNRAQLGVVTSYDNIPIPTFSFGLSDSFYLTLYDR